MQTALTFCWGCALEVTHGQYHWLAGWSPLLVTWQDRRVTAVPIKGRPVSDICFSRRLHFSWLLVSKWKTLQQKSTGASPFLCRGRDIFDWLCSGATLGEVAEQGGSDLYGSSFMSGSSWPKKGDRHSSHLGQAIRPFREAWSPAWDWIIGHIQVSTDMLQIARSKSHSLISFIRNKIDLFSFLISICILFFNWFLIQDWRKRVLPMVS